MRSWCVMWLARGRCVPSQCDMAVFSWRAAWAAPGAAVFLSVMGALVLRYVLSDQVIKCSEIPPDKMCPTNVICRFIFALWFETAWWFNSQCNVFLKVYLKRIFYLVANFLNCSFRVFKTKGEFSQETVSHCWTYLCLILYSLLLALSSKLLCSKTISQ